MTFIHNSINMSDWLLVGVCGCCFPLYETRWSARPVNRLIFLKFRGRRYRLIYCLDQINVYLRLIQLPTQRWLVSSAQCRRLALNQSLCTDSPSEVMGQCCREKKQILQFPDVPDKMRWLWFTLILYNSVHESFLYSDFFCLQIKTSPELEFILEYFFPALCQKCAFILS